MTFLSPRREPRGRNLFSDRAQLHDSRNVRTCGGSEIAPEPQRPRHQLLPQTACSPQGSQDRPVDVRIGPPLARPCVHEVLHRRRNADRVAVSADPLGTEVTAAANTVLADGERILPCWRRRCMHRWPVLRRPSAVGVSAPGRAGSISSRSGPAASGCKKNLNPVRWRSIPTPQNLSPPYPSYTKSETTR